MQERKEGGGELHSHVNFHIIFGRQKSFFFQDGLKVFCLLLIGIAEYRVYRTTVVEKHSKKLILRPFEFEFSRKKSTLES